MKYIIDSSVSFKWVVPEHDSDKADRLRDAYRNAVHELLAPDIFTQELAHALTRAERPGADTRGTGGPPLGGSPPYPSALRLIPFIDPAGHRNFLVGAHRSL